MGKQLLKPQELSLHSEFHYDLLCNVFNDTENWKEEETGPYIVGLNRISYQHWNRDEIYTFILVGATSEQGVYKLVYKHPG